MTKLHKGDENPPCLISSYFEIVFHAILCQCANPSSDALSIWREQERIGQRTVSSLFKHALKVQIGHVFMKHP